MNDPMSRIQRSWRPVSQSLCRILAAWPALWAAIVLGVPGVSQAQGTGAAVAPATSAFTWPAAATPEQALAKAVSQWVGVQQGADPASLRVAPLDPRLQIKPCQAGLRLDFPFASQETVRVRCESPIWQLFVRVQGGSAAQRPTAAAGSAADKPAATRKVVVAGGLLQRGARISAEQLSLVELPAHALPPNVLDKIEDAVNAELIRDIPGGAPL
ncbi:MAG: hypothetical protein RIS88_1123, partial [Pseudomonadota bacterium]